MVYRGVNKLNGITDVSCFALGVYMTAGTYVTAPVEILAPVIAGSALLRGVLSAWREHNVRKLTPTIEGMSFTLPPLRTYVLSDGFKGLGVSAIEIAAGAGYGAGLEKLIS